ncbi:hypothetical protein, partial [Bacillus sp. SIMBA_033]
VCAVMDRLEELPDDRPGYTMDAPGKTEWALRNLLDARSGDDAAQRTFADPKLSDELHPDTAKLVRRFARSLGNKLLDAQRK